MSHLSIFTIVIGVAVTGAALARVTAEERLLRAAYADYDAHARTTKALVPYVS